MRKHTTWRWGTDQQNAFQNAKKLLCSSKLLIHYDPDKPLLLSCDASPYGLGAVLSHRMPDGSERPIAYTSRTLSNAERNYSQIEKEGLAVVYAVKHFHQYLFGQHFTILTDHKPLLGLLAEDKKIPQMAASRIERWALTLSCYNYSLHYRKGENNGNADCMSRLPKATTPIHQNVKNTVMMMQLDHPPVTAKEVRHSTKTDLLVSKVIEYTLNGWPVEHDKELQPYHQRRTELNTHLGCLQWGSRVIIPKSLQSKVITELHETHPGICRMKALARGYVWWPGMDSELEEKVRSCDNCLVNQKMPTAAPTHPWEYPQNPWERIHIDFAGPFLGKMFLIIVDAYSKWLDVIPMNSSTATATIEKLRTLFATHGVPVICVSDNGPSFISDEFKTFLSRNGIRQVLVAPYHPSSNGLAERAVQTFKTSMKKIQILQFQPELTVFYSVIVSHHILQQADLLQNY